MQKDCFVCGCSDLCIIQLCTVDLQGRRKTTARMGNKKRKAASDCAVDGEILNHGMSERQFPTYTIQQCDEIEQIIFHACWIKPLMDEGRMFALWIRGMMESVKIVDMISRIIS